MHKYDTVLPDLTAYTARDGQAVYYRHYPADAAKTLILLHGISEDSKYLHALAHFVATKRLASVYVLDLRGYGTKPARRGDIDYVGQFDDDVEDLIRSIRSNAPEQTIIMGGHSGGGGTSLRTAPKLFAKEIDAYLLLAPAVSTKAPVSRKNQGSSMTQIKMGTIVLLTLLNAIGIRRWNNAVCFVKTKPHDQLHGTETLELSYRLLLSRLPETNYEQCLTAMKQPTLVLVGSEDEEFIASEYKPMFARYGQAEVKVLPGLDHDGLVESELTFHEIERWMARL